MSPLRLLRAAPLIVGLLLATAPSGAAAQEDGLTVISDQAFCELVADDVAACEATLRAIAAEGAVPASLAELLVPPAPAGPSPSGPPVAPQPGAVGTPPESWAAFLARVAEAAATTARLLLEAARAADDFALDELEGILGRVVAGADEELAWLDANPPARCYETIHAEWRGTTERLRAAAATVLGAVAARDPALLEDAVEGLAEYAVEVPRAADELGRDTESIAASCR